ncbi:uncharacterized protein LOC130590147 [Beta vulgaris subsp. vulgaris]|uniref:uncharacterized protein LOC130590147 n=1 Tax=Beta vulgaris subsp. vulgaris TaxID=3555 RepID=UPI00254884BE|nr:uncharacterized protein LOC130590147 [Beta vulgaris subsp. vulgaris]
MNPNENSSSSSDEFFDDYVNNIIAVNECLDEEEDYIIEQAAQMIVIPVAEESSNRRRSYKKLKYIDRDREAANTRLMNDYFVDRPSLFIRVVEAVTAKQHKYFEQRQDATGKLGATPIQKCTTALRMLAYGVAADSIDEYIKIA